MLGLIFSLDYEVYGNGEGDFETLMLKPTEELLLIFKKYGAKLSIMAEVAEIMALRNHKEFDNIREKIEDQLKQALYEGHDVQLHIHPQWFNSKYENGKWVLDYNEYSLANLTKERISSIIRTSKEYLECIGKEVNDKYRCVAFRAGNWLMQPSRYIVESLEESGFLYDTSVFKWGKIQTELAFLDYIKAYSNLYPWRVNPFNINEKTDRPGLFEIPIFTRKVFITSMLTSKRLKLKKVSDSHVHEEFVKRDKSLSKIGQGIKKFRLFYPKKFDFCRMSLNELKNYIDYAIKKCANLQSLIPVVSIGHSKDFHNDGALESLFKYLNVKYKGRFVYTTFAELGQLFH